MAGATFLSSPALLVPRGFPSSSFSSPARRHAYIQVCCQSKAEGFEDEESLQFRRRDFIGGCFTTAIALEYQRPWVEKYQRSRETVSRTNYEVDLITTLTKLSSLGQKINYEAYTYPKQKIDLGKLKL